MLSDRYSVFEAMDFFKKAGFDGVELCFEDLNFRLRPDLWDERVIGPIREHSGELGLPISAVGNHLRYFFDDFMFEAIKRGIRSAKRYGTDVFIFSAMNDATERVRCADLRKVAVSRVRELCKVAEDAGVCLAMEPEPPSIFANTNDFLRLCAEIQSPALGINFDAGHAFLADPDIYESIASLKGLIRHGHIEDMQRGQHLHLMPGEGDMDLPRTFRALRAAGFDGYMSLDLYNYVYEDVAADALAALRKMDG
jgi:sugar phosphate isomerase/epimerase